MKIDGKEEKSSLLKVCDQVRDTVLDEGIQLLDGVNEKTGTPFYFMSKDEISQIRRDREKKRLKEEAKAQARAKREAEAAKLASIVMVEPERFFTHDEEEKVKYSKFDDKGFPTHTADGEEIKKSQKQKCLKTLKAYQKKYAKWKKLQK